MHPGEPLACVQVAELGAAVGFSIARRREAPCIALGTSLASGVDCVHHADGARNADAPGTGLIARFGAAVQHVGVRPVGILIAGVEVIQIGLPVGARSRPSRAGCHLTRSSLGIREKVVPGLRGESVRRARGASDITVRLGLGLGVAVSCPSVLRPQGGPRLLAAAPCRVTACSGVPASASA